LPIQTLRFELTKGSKFQMRNSAAIGQRRRPCLTTSDS
jgi:hypothetical protein